MKTEIQFDIEAATGKDCVLHFSMSGTRAAIQQKLLDMANDMNADYGKPCQGIVSAFKGISHVITPIWGGREY